MTMRFSLEDAIAVLSRTPSVLDRLVRDLPAELLIGNEGPETWSPYDVVGHLIHGERTDWMARARRILEQGETQPFDPFDRFAQFQESQGKSIGQLLDEFAALRAENLCALEALELGPESLRKTGMHPALGRVTLEQLLATWVAHDMDHVAQIARVIAKQYDAGVGPWKEYLSVLSDRQRA
jgi:DinB superfamily